MRRRSRPRPRRELSPDGTASPCSIQAFSLFFASLSTTSLTMRTYVTLMGSCTGIVMGARIPLCGMCSGCCRPLGAPSRSRNSPAPGAARRSAYPAKGRRFALLVYPTVTPATPLVYYMWCRIWCQQLFVGRNNAIHTRTKRLDEGKIQSIIQPHAPPS